MQLTIIQVEREEFLHSRILERSDRIKSDWLQISNDLKEIKKDKLYLRKAKTFEEYCDVFLDLKKRMANQLISSSEVIKNLNGHHGAHLPTSERQARPLTKLEPELQRQAWAEVIEENEPETITAKIITAKVETKIELNEAVREVKRDNMPNTIFVQTPLTDSEIMEKAKEIQQAKPKAHVSHNSGNNEWYTPTKYIESARLVMGSIDLDPASSDVANKTVKAKKFYNQEQNGLIQKWKGNVWLNPPYAQPLINDFSLKILEEIDNIKSIIILVNNATETRWLQRILDKSSVACLVKSRIKFLRPGGEKGAPLQGQVLVYIGQNEKTFIGEFSKYGVCLSRKVR